MTQYKPIVIFKRNQEILATLTLSVTLYFDSIQVNGMLGDLVLEVLDLVSPHATWYRASDMPRNKGISGQSKASCAQLVIDKFAAKEDCFLMLDSGTPLDAVGYWSLKYANVPSYDGDVLGYFQVHMPNMENQHEQLLRLLKSWLEKVDFLHGYAGLSINYDHGDVDKERNVIMRGYCERYLGVNLSDLITERRGLINHVKGAQWLTFIGNTILLQHEHAAIQVHSATDTLRTSQGILIKACDRPLWGDRYHQEDMTAYMKVNGLIKPWLVDNLFPIPGFPDEEATKDWLNMLRPDVI